MGCRTQCQSRGVQLFPSLYVLVLDPVANLVFALLSCVMLPWGSDTTPSVQVSSIMGQGAAPPAWVLKTSHITTSAHLLILQFVMNTTKKIHPFLL